MPDLFFDIPATIKVLGSLGLLLALNAWGRHLSVSLLAGTALLAVWSGHSPPTMARITAERVLSLDHLFLIIVTFEVIWLSSQMARAGVMNDLVGAIRARISRRSAIGVLPAVIGLLPMPGGALFSAPLVDDCDPEKSLSPLLKTRINYWFRHIWEYWWPLYPGVLLALSVTGLDVWEIMTVNLPITIISAVAGWFFLLRKVPHLEDDGARRDGESGRGGDGGRLPVLLSPIFVVIGVYIIVRVLLPSVAAFNRYLPMMIGLATAMGVQQAMRPLGRLDWRTIMLARKTLVLAVLVTLVRLYGAFIEAPLADGLTPVAHMNLELTAWGIPTTAVALLLPFVSGMATGLAIGFVGASFPIVVSLVGGDASHADLLASVVLAYTFGHMGMMLSPVHICLVVTNEHFKTRLTHSIPGVIAPALALLVGAVIVAAVVARVAA